MATNLGDLNDASINEIKDYKVAETYLKEALAITPDNTALWQKLHTGDEIIVKLGKRYSVLFKQAVIKSYKAAIEKAKTNSAAQSKKSSNEEMTALKTILNDWIDTADGIVQNAANIK